MHIKLFDLKNTRKYKFFFIILSYILSIIISVLVYFTGGTAMVYANLMYIPISIISSTTDKYQGMLHAVFSALLVGPIMPLSVSPYVPQEPVNWLVRMFTYITIAFILGLLHEFNKKYEEHITDILTHDSVTMLKNIQSLKKSETRASYPKTIVSLSVKSYNEMISAFGYDFTMEIVIKFSQLLKDLISRFDDVDLYKHEGMSFIIIIDNRQNLSREKTIDEVLTMSDSMKNTLLTVKEIPIYIETIMGIAYLKAGDETLEGVRHSLIAMKYAHSNNLKYAEYNTYLDYYYKNIMNIASNFSSALENNKIRIAAQNIYCQTTNKVYSAELLARWFADNNKCISPGDFIPVIENTELIGDLTRYMIDTAVEVINSNILGTIVLSINFSAKDFNDETVGYLLSKVIEHNIEKGRIQIEITESSIIDRERVEKYLSLISEKGILIAVDDFGTGYSSYQYVSELPVNTVKIDKSLIDKIGDSKIAKDAVKSIVSFFNTHNIVTVAEGVENKKIADACIEVGINYMQGYYFHKPSLLNISSVSKKGAF